MFGFKRKQSLSERTAEDVGPGGFIPFLGSTPPDVDPRYRVTPVMEALPVGIVIRRIRPRSTMHKWAVRFRTASTDYYGETLRIALDNFFGQHPDQKAEYQTALNTMRVKGLEVDE